MAGALTIVIILVIFFVAGGLASAGFRAARTQRRALKELRQRWPSRLGPPAGRGRPKVRSH